MWDSGGGETVPRGTVDIGTPIRLHSGRRLTGFGRASVLRAQPELKTGVLVGFGADRVSDVALENFTLDLSLLTSGTTKAVQITNGSDIRLTRMRIVAAPEVGALFISSQRVSLVDCTFETTAGGVWFNNGSHDCSVTDSTMRDRAGKCILFASGSLRGRAVTNDLAITGPSAQECVGFENDCHDALVLGNYCVGAPDENCIGVGGHRSKVLGNTVASTGRHGISVGDGTTNPIDMVVQGNVVSNAGQDGTAAWAGIVLQGAQGAIITGNRVTGCDEYGIKGNSENYCVVAHNDLRGNVTAPKLLSGANNVVANNVE